MNIVIFGANGPTGKILTKQALEAGHMVTAVTRHPQAFPLHAANLRVMQGDVLNLAAVEQAVAGQDAVLSTLGVPFSREPITLYSQSMTHILQAMSRYDVRRLVCVTSSAVEPQHDSGGGFFFEKVLKPVIISTFGRTLYIDMRRMEALVMNSDLDWTIVRPSGLFETPHVTEYQVAETAIRGQFTSRTDLADCMLRQLTDKRYLRKAVGVATFSVKPNIWAFLTQEAFKREPAVRPVHA